ncbi:MAG TPA: hypothetical protein VF921_19775 [Vicinamibacterales bacterium]
MAKQKQMKEQAKQAAAGGCMDTPDAEALVRSCAGGDFSPDTKLGDIFQSADQRKRFCRCVADGSGIGMSKIPCGAGDTIGAVLDAITC